MNSKDYIRYAVLGLGAVVVQMVAVKYGGSLMNNAILGYSVMGVTVGGLLAAGVGVLAADQIMK
jgi:hypothetical protein